MVYTLKFDGCCNPNPGDMGIGIVVWNDDEKKIIEISEKCGFGTNNQAEYNAVIRGLEELSKIYTEELLVLGDSQLVINQLNGQWRVKKEDLIPLFERVIELEKKFKRISYQWIEREDNKDADYLSAKAIGIESTRKKDVRVHLEVENSYEFIFDDDEKNTTVKDEKYDREVQRFYVKGSWKNGKKTVGNYFETGSKKLLEKFNYYKPLKDKKFRIIPTRARNWIEYIVEEIIDEGDK